MKALTHANVFDFDTYQPDRYVLFDDQIQQVGPMTAFPGAEEETDCTGGLVIPGLVVGHAHIYSTLSRGWNAPFAPQSFRQLLEQMWWKLDAALDNRATYASGLYSALSYAKHGVTTVIDHHASGTEIGGSLEALRRAVVEEGGLRGVFCFETSERFPLGACIEENVRFAQAHRNETDCAGMFGMHALMTLSDCALDAIAEQSGDLPVHIHVAESEEDEAQSLRDTGKRIIDRLAAFGLLRPRSIVSHGVHLCPEEVAQLAGKPLFLALNPTSNLNNGVGLPDLHAFQKAGLRCILGNDGMGYGLEHDMQNLVFGMHGRYQDPLAASTETLCGILRNTYACAEAQLGCRLGRVAPGYAADLVFLPYTPPTPLRPDNVWGHFFFGLLDQFQPYHVWCKGQPVLRAGRPVRLEENAVCALAREAAQRVWKKTMEI